MSRHPVLLSLAVCGLLGACTHLSSGPDRHVTGPQQALTGATYSLPMLQYQLTLTRTLTGCPMPVPVLGVDLIEPSLTFKTEAKATSRYVRGESFVVDYGALSSVFKTSSFAIERYPSGTLKSLNAAAEDLTGDILKDAVKTAIQTAAIVTGAPSTGGTLANVSGPGGGDTPNVVRTPIEQKMYDLVQAAKVEATLVACREFAVTMVTDRADNRQSSKETVKALDGINKEIANTTLVVNLKVADKPAAVRLVAVKGAPPAPPPSSATLAEELGRQLAASEKIAGLDEDLADLDKALAVTKATYWPQRFTDRSGAFPLEATEQAKLSGLLEVRRALVLDKVKFAEALSRLSLADRLALLKAFPKPLAGYLNKYGVVQPVKPARDVCQGPKADVGACLDATLAVRVALASTAFGLKPCPSVAADFQNECLSEAATPASGGTRNAVFDATPVDARDNTPDAGVFVREPAEGKLVVCQGAGACNVEGDSLVTLDGVFAPQLGQLRFLPFRNGPFESNSLSVSLTEDGHLEKIEYKRLKASGQMAAATAADVASQINTERLRRDKEKTDAIAAARTEAAAVRSEAAAIRTEQAALHDQDAAAIQSQIDLLTKQNALKKLQTPETPDAFAAMNEEIDRNTKEAALLQSRLTRSDALAAALKAGLPGL